MNLGRTIYNLQREITKQKCNVMVCMQCTPPQNGLPIKFQFDTTHCARFCSSQKVSMNKQIQWIDYPHQVTIVLRLLLTENCRAQASWKRSVYSKSSQTKLWCAPPQNDKTHLFSIQQLLRNSSRQTKFLNCNQLRGLNLELPRWSRRNLHVQCRSRILHIYFRFHEML